MPERPLRRWTPAPRFREDKFRRGDEQSSSDSKHIPGLRRGDEL
jgi:hypothetical protein